MANETTDFLTALASRNGLAADEALPAVQPRIPSRFEPASPDAGAWLMESSVEIEAARDEHRFAQPRATAPTDMPATSATPPPALTPSHAQTARPAQTITHPSLRVIERVVHERETQTIRVVEREQLTEHVPRRDVLGDEAAAAPSPTQALAQPATPVPQPQPIQQTSAFVPKPPATPSPSTPQTAPQPATTQPPDVHITIGRIEVRANVSKKSEPARNKPNAPNLERYLNSLSGNSGGDG